MKTNCSFKRIVAMFAAVCMLAVMFAPIAAQTALASEQSEPTINYNLRGSRLAQKTDIKAVKTVYYNGDVNLDGEVNTGDAVLALKYASGLATYDALQAALGDPNHNGEMNTGDASYILRMAVGLEALETIDISTDKYTVTFVAGIEGASAVPETETHAEGAECTIPATEMTCAEQRFLGWKASFDNNTYAPGASYTMPKSDITFTGLWESTALPKYTVSIALKDVVNNASVTTLTAEITETTTFTEENLDIPDGYKLEAGQTLTVTVSATGATPSALTANVYGCTTVSGDEYKIITAAAGLEYIRDHAEDNFFLKNDIDMSSVSRFVPIGWADGGYGDDYAFTGVFDGNGCTITNFECDWFDGIPIDEENYYEASSVGLFAHNEGIIRNLNVDTKLYAEGQSYGVYGAKRVGIIAGMNEEEGKIDNCHVYGFVGSSDMKTTGDVDTTKAGAAGGISGVNSGIINNCSAVCAVEGFIWLGGVSGKNFGTISGTWFAGGINAGVSDQVLQGYQIRNIGGICGGLKGAIKNCYVLLLDYLKGYSCIGGVVGWANGGSIDNVYIAGIEGDIYGAEDYGMLLGYYASTMPSYSGCYNCTGGIKNMPKEFTADVWDFGGALYEDLPDLINNRRPSDLRW